jgi:hypothetical protein
MLSVEIHTAFADWIAFSRENSDILDRASIHRPRIQGGNITLRITRLPADCASRFSTLRATCEFTLSTPEHHMVWFTNK